MWVGSGNFATGNMLGRFEGSNGNQRTSNTYDIPPGVDELTLNFTFYEIDSWDGEEFRVFVDGQLYHSRSYQVYNNAGDVAGMETLTNGQGDVIGQVVHDESMYAVATSGWVDQAHHYTLTIPVDPSAGQVTIGFGSTLDEAKSNESWGIDNLNLAITGSTSDAIGLEDTAITLDVASALVDTDGSESLTLTFSGMPTGAVLSAGQQNQDGTWTLTAAELDSLTITPAEHFNDTGDAIEAVQITQLPEHGQILLDTNGDGSFETAVALNTSVSRTDIESGRLILRPEAEFSGQVTVDFQ
ncbi:hypothetical protein CAPTEDRAFT_211942, partial [Capitella teleta]